MIENDWFDISIAIPAPYSGIKRFKCKIIKGSADPKEVIEVRAAMHKDWQRLSFGDWCKITHWMPLRDGE